MRPFFVWFDVWQIPFDDALLLASLLLILTGLPRGESF